MSIIIISLSEQVLVRYFYQKGLQFSSPEQSKLLGKGSLTRVTINSEICKASRNGVVKKEVKSFSRNDKERLKMFTLQVMAHLLS